MSTEFDKGPPIAFARHFDLVPDPPVPSRFWFDWGPIFYRGRLNGTARVLCIGSDPGATERIAGRALVGDAGQRVQGFLAKLGLTRSYACLNVFCWGLFPSQAGTATSMMSEPAQMQWRNRLYDMVRSSQLSAVIAFGAVARTAVQKWPGKGALPVFDVPHPSSHDETVLLDRWRAAVTALRDIVTPDADGDASRPNYGSSFQESDYAAIPRADLPFGAPSFLGDDAWLRARGDRTSVWRPSPDDGHTLTWIAPQP
jgi:hypothetical protein